MIEYLGSCIVNLLNKFSEKLILSSVESAEVEKPTSNFDAVPRNARFFSVFRVFLDPIKNRVSAKSAVIGAAYFEVLL